VADDLRHRYAEAIAAKFTEPIYRCDPEGSNERVENAEPADRIDQTPYVMVTAGDGFRSFWTPTCAELGEVVAAVRDEEMETARKEVARLAAAVGRGQALHSPNVSNPLGAWCDACMTSWPCNTFAALDDQEAASLPPETPAPPQEET
jgi:hypothetical protein